MQAWLPLALVPLAMVAMVANGRRLSAWALPVGFGFLWLALWGHGRSEWYLGALGFFALTLLWFPWLLRPATGATGLNLHPPRPRGGPGHGGVMEEGALETVSLHRSQPGPPAAWRRMFEGERERPYRPRT